MGIQSEMENDAIAFIHASDAEPWAVFLQRILCGDKYKIQSSFHAPLHDHVPDLFSSSKTCAVLVSPSLLKQDYLRFWNRCVKRFDQKTVILFLGVNREDMRESLGEVITEKVLQNRCLEVDSSRSAVNSILIELIETYEAVPRQRNSVLTVIPTVLYERGNQDVLILLEEEAEDTVTISTEGGCDPPRNVRVERVTSSAYIATLPDNLLGKVNLVVRAGKHNLGHAIVRVESSMVQLRYLLEKETSPLTLLCNAMGVSRAGRSYVEELDSLLAGRLAVSQFPAELMGVIHSGHPTIAADHEDRQWPTLLHFAAEFKLRQVCDELLLCPGMIHAACTKNSEGLLPCQLAERKGYYALQKRLLQYVKDMKGGSAEEEDSEENDTPTPHSYSEENNTPTPSPKEEQARRVANAPVSHSHPTPAQHRPDSGISENSDCEDRSVPPRTASTHTHHQQDFGSPGKAHSRVDSTNGSSAGIDTLATRHSSEFRAESVSADGSVTGSRLASQASSISSLSESDTDAGTGTCRHVLQDKPSLRPKNRPTVISKFVQTFSSLKHAISDSDLSVKSKNHKTLVVYARPSTMHTSGNPLGCHDVSSILKSNISSVCSDISRDSGTVCDEDGPPVLRPKGKSLAIARNSDKRNGISGGRPMSVRVQLAVKENLSEVPTLPIRDQTRL